MPVPKRWHPVSRDLNQDPELWELTTLYGERALRVWLEILAGADKTSNRISLSGLWLSLLAQLTRMNLKTVAQIILWMIERNWIEVQGDLPSVNRWVEKLRERCQDLPKTHRKLPEDSLKTARRLPTECLENDRALFLATCNYWKYRKRREVKGAVDGLPPSLPVSSLLKEREEKTAVSPLSSAESRTAATDFRTALPPTDEQRVAIERVTGPLKQGGGR